MKPDEIRRRLLKWSVPVVTVITLPAHAQMSGYQPPDDDESSDDGPPDKETP